MTLTVEFLVGMAALISLISGASVAFTRQGGRIDTLERVVNDFINDRRVALERVVTHMERIERKVDTISLRCVAFHHATVKPVSDLLPPVTDGDEQAE